MRVRPRARARLRECVRVREEAGASARAHARLFVGGLSVLTGELVRASVCGRARGRARARCLVAQESVHDGDVLPGPVVVEEVAVAAVPRRNPPAVQFGSVGHAEIDIFVRERRAVRAAVRVRCLACCAACRGGNRGERSRRGDYNGYDYDGEDVSESNGTDESSCNLEGYMRLTRFLNRLGTV